jgi:hypothetical protein
MSDRKNKNRYISEKVKKQILKNQKGKCANEPGSNLFRIGDFPCPLWKLKEYNGTFNEAGYEFDHVIEHCKTNDNSISNLQALCPFCHSFKTKEFRKEDVEERRSRIDKDFLKNDNDLSNELSDSTSNESAENTFNSEYLGLDIQKKINLKNNNVKKISDNVSNTFILEFLNIVNKRKLENSVQFDIDVIKKYIAIKNTTDYIEYYPYVIDFDIVVEWLQIGHKPSLRRTLYNSYIINHDYIKFSREQNKSKCGSGGHNRINNLITVHCFNNIVTNSRTLIGNKVIEYLICLDEFVIENRNEIINALIINKLHN